MSGRSAAFENEVAELARRIAEAGASQSTGIYHMGWWSDRLLSWAMDHPDFKTQLFRFIDVFPACVDDEDTMRHLQEYFAPIEVPRTLDLGLEAAGHIPFGSRITASVVRRNVLRMATQLIAGSTPEEAAPKLAELWRQGEATTVDLLGEKTVTDAEAARYAGRVHELLDVLAAQTAEWPDDPHLERDPWGPVPRVNVSIKPTALAPQFGPLEREVGLEQARSRMRKICAHAQQVGAALYLDMESYEVKDLTIELIRGLCSEFDSGVQIGAVIQAYLKDSHDDLVDLISWAQEHRRRLNVRLVKGAYWDFETVIAGSHGWPVPVFEQKAQTDANYERCIDAMVDAAGTIRPAFGSHNIRSLAYAMTAAAERGLHASAIELQLLFGMAEPVHAALRRLGMRVRAYTPIGEMVPGMAYLVRRLLENTANESFLRHRFAEGEDLESLIRPPDAGPLPGPVVAAPRQETSADAPGPFSNEPPAEFRRSLPRERMLTAVERAASAAALPIGVVVDGERVAVAEEMASTDPADPSRVVARVGVAGPSEVDRAVSAALRDQPGWGARSARDRAAVLFRAAAILRGRRDELAALEVFEAGKPWAQADGDVCEAIDFCEYYAREALRLWSGAPVASLPGEQNVYRYQPRGIAAVIAPWNFPLAIPCGMTAAALAAGNAVLLKPAEQTPAVAWRLAEALLEAGVPSGVLAFLPGFGEDIGAYLVDHPQVSVIAFTGSKEVGLHIVERAGVTGPDQLQVKRVIAEMGGKNAVVVDSDADLDVAVPAIVDSAFAYAGQKCSAASRVIAVRATFDELVERLVGATRLVTVGAPRDMATMVGPVIDEEAWKKVRSYQELAHVEGEVVLQRTDVPEQGWFVGPTVMVTDDPSCRVATEEIFGPVVACMRAEDFEGAIALANASPYALTGGVFSRSPSRIKLAASTFRAGNLYINRSITGSLVGRQPFGGLGLSGVGSKAGGPDYLRQFTDPQVVTENTIRQGFAPLDT